MQDAHANQTRSTSAPINADEQSPIESWDVIQRFESIVELYPDRCAAVDDTNRLTYSQLNQRANLYAHALLEHQVDREQPIGLAIPKSCELIAALIGILKAGCAYLPCVDNQPIARLNSMLDGALCSIIIGRSGFLDELESNERIRITPESITQQISSNTSIKRSPDHLAYILYTSGSTGTPKGVMIEDQGIIRLVCNQTYLPFGPDLHYLFAAPLSFDVSTLEIFTPLLHGAKLVILPHSSPDPEYIKALCHREQVQSTCLAFSLFKSLFQSSPDIFKHIPLVAVGGEQVDPKIIAIAQEQLPNTTFINAYGPTEATMLATTYSIPTLNAQPPNRVPIGQPLDRMNTYILDDQLNEVQPGTIGELCLSGTGLARGYLNNPEQTLSKFVHVTLKNKGETRIYRTGDRAFIDENNQVVFVGRDDHQVKLRGYRIELDDIESNIIKHPAIDSATALLIGKSNDQLGLAITSSDSNSITTQEAHAHLVESLPQYMIPDSIVILEGVPLTRNGKKDLNSIRAQLEESTSQRTTQSTEISQSNSPTLLWLISELKDLLDTDHVNPQDHFLHIGGHSLKAIVLCARIRNRYALNIKLSKFYQLQSIDEIAHWIDSKSSDSVPTQFKVDPDTDRSPLAFNQQRLWMLNTLSPDDQSYTITVQLNFKGKLDRSAFNSAWNTLLDRHHILRSKVQLVNNDPYLMIDRTMHTPIKWIEQAHRSINDLIDEETSTPFNIEIGPLAQCTVVSSKQDDTVIIMMHHMLTDAWSSKIIQSEIRELYDSFTDLREPNLPTLNAQYTDYARWQSTLPETSHYRTDLEFWKSNLLDHQITDLPIDYPRSPNPSHEGDRVSYKLSDETYSKIVSHANDLGVTPYSLTFAIFKIWLARLTTHQDILVGTTIANRQWSQTENLIGFFMETIPIRSTVQGQSTLDDIIRTVSDNTLNSFDHSSVPFQHIVDSTHAHTVQGRNPLFEIFFNHIAVNLASDQSEQFAFAKNAIDNHTAKFDLTCYIFESTSSMEVVFNYRSTLFKPETINRYLDQFVRLINQAHAHRQTPIAQLPILSDQEQARADLLEQPSLVSKNPSTPSLIHERIEQSCKANPDQIALVWGENQSLTFSDLWNRSTHIARQLIAQGVTPSDRVPIIVSSPDDLVSSILATLRIGATYIPLDPTWPTHRFQQIIDSIDPSIIITDQIILIKLDVLTISIPTYQLESSQQSSSPDQLFPEIKVSPDSPAYIIFTSGSTAQPKGVVQSHENVCAQMDALIHSLDLSNNDTLLQLSSPSFDSAIMDLYSVMFTGATLCVADIQQLDHRTLNSLINQYQVSIFHSAPTLWRWYSSHNDQPNLSVHTLLLGGEPLTKQDLLNTQTVFPNCKTIINGMGMTESSLTLQQHIKPSKLDQFTHTIPVGLPTKGTSVRLLDHRGNKTQLAGEIEIQSNRIALGCWNPKTKSVDDFKRPSTTSENPSNRFLTGDLGRMNPDGSITHIGRKDLQIKVQGCRIEPEEVQSKIKSIPGVLDACVLTQLDPSSRTKGHVLVGYIVSQNRTPNSKSLNAQSLKAQLSDLLPSYMIPTIWHRIDQIPRLGNGKVDRNALRDARSLTMPVSDLCTSSKDDHDSHSLPIIIEAFQQVLSVPIVNPNDDLFQLGGNSLKAIRIFTIIKQRTNTNISVAELYRSPTPILLARLIDNSSDSTHNLHDSIIPLGGRSNQEPLYLFPGIGGHPIGFSPLTKLLSTNHQYKGIQLPSTSELDSIGHSIPNLASWIINEHKFDTLKQSPPMIGYSFGGALAFEIALQLQSLNKEPNTLLLLDAHLPTGLPKKKKPGAILAHLLNLISPEDQTRIQYIQSKRKGTTAQPQTLSAHDNPEDLRSFKQNAKSNRAMLLNYTPVSRYNSPIHLIKAIQPQWLKFHVNDHVNGWSKHINTNDLHQTQVKANHLDMFKEQPAQVIAQQINHWLNQ